MTSLLGPKYEAVRAAFSLWSLHRSECDQCRRWEEYDNGDPCDRGLDIINLMGKALARTNNPTV